LDVGWIEVKVKVAPWFSSETLALYKSLTYLLTYLLTRFLKKQNVLCTLLVIKTPKDLGCIATLPWYVAKVKDSKMLAISTTYCCCFPVFVILYYQLYARNICLFHLSLHWKIPRNPVYRVYQRVPQSRKFTAVNTCSLHTRESWWFRYVKLNWSPQNGGGDWKCGSGKCDTDKNARVENAGV